MQGDYQSSEKLLTRKSLFAFAQQPSFATRFVPEFITCESGMKILDTGCGTGEDLATINATITNCTLFGLDNSRGMITEAKTKVPNATLLVADMETFSLPEKFDRIIVRHALHLANDKKKAIENIFNHLAPQGKAIFALHSIKSLPKMTELITAFCKTHNITFLQGQDALAIERSQKLFTPYKTDTKITHDIITLTEPTPYLNYLESRRKSFSPFLSDEVFAKLSLSLKEIIEKEVNMHRNFTEISSNGIITLYKEA
jgi:ubiquinone/menaquinone biosynthesis C-methylase UbiE